MDLAASRDDYNVRSQIVLQRLQRSIRSNGQFMLVHYPSIGLKFISSQKKTDDYFKSYFNSLEFLL